MTLQFALCEFLLLERNFPSLEDCRRHLEEFPGLKENNVVGRWNSEVASKVAEGSGTNRDNVVQ